MATAKLDRSLGDIIAEEGKSGGNRREGKGPARRGARRGGNAGPGPRRSSGNRDRSNPLSRDDSADGGDDQNGYQPERRERRERQTPYDRPPRAQGGFQGGSAWQHDMFPSTQPRQISRANLANMNKVIVSNLDADVSVSDLQSIFKEVGPVTQVALNYDPQGKHLGTADVVFADRESAEKCFAEFDSAEVDGRPMTVKLAVPISQTPTPAPAPRVSAPIYDNGNNFNGGSFNGGGRRGGAGFNSAPRSRTNSIGRPSRGGGSRGGGRPASSRGNGSARGGRGGGRGGRKEKESVSAEQLDAEMDEYRKPATAAE